MARILVSDDDDSVRALVCRALTLDGHDVIAACDGAEALAALTGDAAFDLLLSDIRMPVMDGIALALAAARERPGLVILLMTGFADQRERAAGLDALIHDVLTKPFGLANLRAAVGAALASREIAA
jgi:CheY-like chemotaxis protein